MPVKNITQIGHFYEIHAGAITRNQAWVIYKITSLAVKEITTTLFFQRGRKVHMETWKTYSFSNVQKCSMFSKLNQKCTV